MEERLQKYMARCGVASRRKCETIIIEGRVRVNDMIVSELGIKVNPDFDKIFFDNKLIKPEERNVYLMLNKPVNCISSVKDEKGRKTIIDIIDVKERIYPIGRLDYDTSGLILLTNDGKIYNKIIHPRQNINKVYIANIEGIPNEKEIERFKNGVDIGGYITSRADFEILKNDNLNSTVKITIHEGKNRQVRKMCDAIGHTVITLKRVSIGKIKLENLPLGEYRELTKDEILYLQDL